MAENKTVEDLIGRVKELMGQYVHLSGECDQLKRQNQTLQTKNVELTTALMQSKKELDSLQLNRALSLGGDDNKRAIARVNRLMREVDKCIALLHN